MAVVNVGDVIATLIYVIFVILIVAIIFLAFKRVMNSRKENQIINEKLDTIMKKLDEQNKN